MTVSTNHATRAITRLEFFLQDICSSDAHDCFVRRLASKHERWSSVEQLLDIGQKALLHEIAFQTAEGGFSACNLKAHYVLDEDFIDGGSALVIFSLVGSTWTLVLRLKNQSEFIAASEWLNEVRR